MFNRISPIVLAAILAYFSLTNFTQAFSSDTQTKVVVWKWEEYLRNCKEIEKIRPDGELPVEPILQCLRYSEVWGKMSAKERDQARTKTLPLVKKIYRWKLAWQSTHPKLSDALDYLFLNFVEKDSDLRVMVKKDLF